MTDTLVIGWKGDTISKRIKKRPLIYASKFEEAFHKKFPKLQYEPTKIKYTVEHTYTPDWKIKDGVFIETKGFWRAQDRAKHLHLKEQYPDLIIYLVFQDPNKKISRVSHTTYGEWATKHGIPWATLDTIPEAWFAS